MELTEQNLVTVLTSTVEKVYTPEEAAATPELVESVVEAYRAGTLDRTLIATFAWNILGDMNKAVTLILELNVTLPGIPERDYTQIPLSGK